MQTCCAAFQSEAFPIYFVFNDPLSVSLLRLESRLPLSEAHAISTLFSLLELNV